MPYREGVPARPLRWGVWFTSLSDPAITRINDGTAALVLSGAAKWVLGATLYVDGGTGFEHEPWWAWTFPVNAAGELIPNPQPGRESTAGFFSMPLGWIRRAMERSFQTNRDCLGQDPRVFATELFGYVKPLFLALSFMHCKNVRQVVQSPPPKLAKRRAARGRPPLCTYRVLDIQPMRRVLVREGGGESGEAGKKAFHIVRGHFKTYTEAKPLLGHAVGTFWFPQHIAGSKAHGVVAKDYTVEAPV